MRFLGRSLSLSLLFAGFSFCALAQEQNLTDAERTDLAGPVKSVSVRTATATGVIWSQPDGPTLVFPIWCHECEFDPNGNRTKLGQIIDGGFQGETVHLFFDGAGHITERIAEDATTGETVRREITGPFGNTEESSYRDGSLQSRVLFTYDQYGHRIDWLTLDGGGNQQGRTVVHTDKDGNDTEQWGYGKEGELLLHFRQTFDPKTKIEHFTSLDQSGSMKLTWTVTGGMLSSFWQLPGSPAEYGDGFRKTLVTIRSQVIIAVATGPVSALAFVTFTWTRSGAIRRASNGGTSPGTCFMRHTTTTKSTATETGHTVPSGFGLNH
jgi:hypothetical protein